MKRCVRACVCSGGVFGIVVLLAAQKYFTPVVCHDSSHTSEEGDATNLHGAYGALSICLDPSAASKLRQKSDEPEDAFLSTLLSLPNVHKVQSEVCELFDEDSFAWDASTIDLWMGSEAASLAECANLKRKSVAKPLAQRLKRAWQSGHLEDTFYLLNALTLTENRAELEIGEDIRNDQMLPVLLQKFTDIGLYTIPTAEGRFDNEASLSASDFAWGIAAHILITDEQFQFSSGEISKLKNKFLGFIRVFDLNVENFGSQRKAYQDALKVASRIITAYFRLARRFGPEWFEADPNGNAEGLAAVYDIEVLTGLTNLIREVNKLSRKPDSKLLPDVDSLNSILHALLEADASGVFGFTFKNAKLTEDKTRIEVTVVPCSALGHFLDDVKLNLIDVIDQNPDDQVFTLAPAGDHYFTAFDIDTRHIVQPNGQVIVPITVRLKFSRQTDQKETIVKISRIYSGISEIKLGLVGLGVSLPSHAPGDYLESSVQWETKVNRIAHLPVAPASQHGRLFLVCRLEDTLTNLTVNPEQSAVLLTLKDSQDIPRHISASRQIFLKHSSLFGFHYADMGLEDKRLMQIDGQYDFAIVASGPKLISSPLKKHFATVSMHFRKPIATVPIPVGASSEGHTVNTVRVTPYDLPWFPQPLIHHTFGPPRQFPSNVVVWVFLILCTVVPLFGYWTALRKFGVNLEGFPTANRPKGSIFKVALHVLFQVLLISCFGVIGLYWWRLTLIKALKILMPLGAATCIVGSHVLSEIRSLRLHSCAKETVSQENQKTD